ncbi:mitochondrial carrier [Martensiomyces pterosporus]|nr:mitochondrial carrier [Martensiomyces pterosporus]
MSLSKDALPPFGHAIAGAGSSALALFLIYPLDTIKTRLQVQTRSGDDEKSYKNPIDAVRKILVNEGIGGLYAGLATNLANQLINGFVYFYAYSIIRKFALRATSQNGKSLSTAVELLVGAVAGMANQLITLPIGVIATRQQTAHHSERVPWYQTVSEIIQSEGIPGLWAGFRPAMLLCSNPAITYGAFEKVKGVLLKDRESQYLTSAEAFWAGALSKTLATIITYPYIMAKVRLQWRPSKEELEAGGDEVVYKSSADVLMKVLRREGIPGWYKGMQTQIIKAVITQALMLMIKESFTLQVIRLFGLARAGRKSAAVAA